MEQKLLVANRGEIACRIFQACRELGITAVGVVAPGDEESRHVTYAQELVPIKSYLDAEEILRAARATQAKLIHPGYGFLSERSHFAAAVEEAGLSFVGPRAKTMDELGEKTSAKVIAEKAKVPTLPWARVSPGDDLKKIAAKIGFPLLLKAAAGGGGKGMRRVDKESDLDESAQRASSEALSAFGDGALFMERLLENPRHIEIQIFGDGNGHVVHLYERECSLQRRHQKIWEEARPIHLSEKTLAEMQSAALRLAQEVKYRSAGTLEFLVDEKENFYFLEMNTRLQVEHPVTELVTCTDLVHAQIRQALYPTRPALNVTPAARGHSIEVRLYAEDPYRDFMPTGGKIELLRWPTGNGIRVETGIEESQKTTTNFDPMLAKLIVWAENRDQALARMKFALEETVILGVVTNQPYLLDLLELPELKIGKVHTGTLGARKSELEPKLTSVQGACFQIPAKKSRGATSKAQIASAWEYYGK